MNAHITSVMFSIAALKLALYTQAKAYEFALACRRCGVIFTNSHTSGLTESRFPVSFPKEGRLHFIVKVPLQPIAEEIHEIVGHMVDTVRQSPYENVLEIDFVIAGCAERLSFVYVNTTNTMSSNSLGVVADTMCGGLEWLAYRHGMRHVVQDDSHEFFDRQWQRLMVEG